MSVSDLLSPLPKSWANLNVNSINVAQGMTSGPFNITETVSTGPSTITGDVGSFNGQLLFTTTNTGANYALVGPEVTSNDGTARVKMYASNAPESTSGLQFDGSCKLTTFQANTTLSLNPFLTQA